METGRGEAAEMAREGRPSAEVWRGGGIMTGEREIPEREMSGAGEVGRASVGTEWERTGGVGAPRVTKPTCRTLGSMTVREVRRRSMDQVAPARRAAEGPTITCVWSRKSEGRQPG